MHLNQKDSATLLSITSRTLRNLAPPRLENGKYDSAAIVRWFVRKEIAKLEKLQVAASPALERYREGQATWIEMRIEKEKRTLIPEEDVRECFEQISMVYARAAKAIQAAGYTEAWEILEATLRESLRVFDRECEIHDANEKADPDPDLDLEGKPPRKRKSKTKSKK